MRRFGAEANDNILRRLLVPIISLMIGLAVFCYASDSFASGTADREKAALEDAVRSSVVFCYSIEGAYPEDVEYLEEHYGLNYDKNRFFVGYRLQGSNIMPDITIIDTKE